jgi:hypothetical protein
MMRTIVLATAFCLAACGSGSGADGGPDANVPPPCAQGVQFHGDYATCGPGCDYFDPLDGCAPGWYCTCNGMCMWWENGFPHDAGPFGCGGAPDAGVPDGGMVDGGD